MGRRLPAAIAKLAPGAVAAEADRSSIPVPPPGRRAAATPGGRPDRRRLLAGGPAPGCSGADARQKPRPRDAAARHRRDALARQPPVSGGRLVRGKFLLGVSGRIDLLAPLDGALPPTSRAYDHGASTSRPMARVPHPPFGTRGGAPRLHPGGSCAGTFARGTGLFRPGRGVLLAPRSPIGARAPAASGPARPRRHAATDRAAPWRARPAASQHRPRYEPAGGGERGRADRRRDDAAHAGAFVVLLMTSFTRIVIVLGFVRTALGTPARPRFKSSWASRCFSPFSMGPC